MRHQIAVLITIAIMPALTLSRAAGQDKPDLDKFLARKAGTIPVIVSAPHGGRIRLPEVPDRKGDGIGKFVVVNDTNTDVLAEKLAEAIAKKLGGRPYFVIAHFERKQADANRPAESAYEDPKAKPYYDAYHKALADSTAEVRKTWGRGLLLDLHAQAADANAIFRGTQNLKSVAALKDRFGMKALTGPNSVLGYLAREKSIAVIPAIDADPTAKEDSRFNGGYIVKTYGSDAGTGVDAIQLEFGGKFRTKAALDQTATDVAEAVAAFQKAYLPAEKLPGK